MLFPSASGAGPATRLELAVGDDGFPIVMWAGFGSDDEPAGSGSLFPLTMNGPGMPLLGEHGRARFTRPHLRGHRVLPGDEGAYEGLGWSTLLQCDALSKDDDRLVVEASDPQAGLAVRVEFESIVGGALRGRAILTNTRPGRYLLDGLDIVLPAPSHLTDVLDFTGRHERERSPQRHQLTDGLWLRESRAGRPGLDAATMVVLGTPGFSFGAGELLAVHVAWSGNTVMRVERDAATGATIGGGELLHPGEVSLGEGDSYTTPWVMFASSAEGLDGLAWVWHSYQRSLAAHPSDQPVILNVWEAVFFDHDLQRLKAIADRAAQVGVERFVLDDGWFRNRRDDTAGLGDWWTDEDVWPQGLEPLVSHVHSLGMSFGLWFEPEMVNPDSDLYREHPDWILSTGGRVPRMHRNQQVLDLSRSEVFTYIYDRMDDMLTSHPIDYVKWDHNRDLLEAGTGRRGGAPGAHDQTTAFYRLLDALRDAHPGVAWESCASGGGRIDLGVLERVERVWTSDMTDALARQQIQRWTTQLVAPEYIGAHVSATTSHTTGRTLSLDLRAATAMFGAFGIEWDLTLASDDELERLADWVGRHKRFRPLLHSGRVVRPESTDPAVLLHGVVARDGSEALLAHVQLDESTHNRGVVMRVVGLHPLALYNASWEGPTDPRQVSMSAALPPHGPTGGLAVSGLALGSRGLWFPRRKPETVTLVHLSKES